MDCNWRIRKLLRARHQHVVALHSDRRHSLLCLSFVDYFFIRLLLQKVFVVKRANFQARLLYKQLLLSTTLFKFQPDPIGQQQPLVDWLTPQLVHQSHLKRRHSRQVSTDELLVQLGSLQDAPFEGSFLLPLTRRHPPTTCRTCSSRPDRRLTARSAAKLVPLDAASS